jgi:hypothetical protein
MVQYTNILVISAVAAAVPALAAPLAYMESREIENVNAREPILSALKKIATDGPARKTIITNPIKDKVEKAIKGQPKPAPSGPTPAQLAMAQVKKDQAAKERAAKEKALKAKALKKRDLEELLERDSFLYTESREIEDIDAREPILSALKKIATDGPARKTIITNPIKDKAEKAIKGQQKAAQSGPTPAQLAMAQVKKEQAAKDLAAKEKALKAKALKKRDLEELLERDFFNLD